MRISTKALFINPQISNLLFLKKRRPKKLNSKLKNFSLISYEAPLKIAPRTLFLILKLITAVNIAKIEQVKNNFKLLLITRERTSNNNLTLFFLLMRMTDLVNTVLVVIIDNLNYLFLHYIIMLFKIALLIFSKTSLDFC